MSLEDYKINMETAEVTRGTEVLAKINTQTGEVLEYVNSGGRCKRWIGEALKNASFFQEATEEADISFEECYEIVGSVQAKGGVIPSGYFRTYKDVVTGEIFMKRDFYSVFKNAPRPRHNKVGYKNVMVYDWVKKDYPQLVEILYADGPWNKTNAGCAKNLTHPVRGQPREISTIQG